MAGITRIYAILLLATLAGCQSSENASSPPLITTQGFDISSPRQGPVGDFSPVRVRIQVPGKLESLSIRAPDRQLELAHGAKRQQLEWFGLQGSPRSSQDFTLDLSPYINLWIRQPGEYLFAVKVQDQAGLKAEVSLQIIVH